MSKPVIDDVVVYDEEYVAAQCWEEEEHQSLTTGTFNLGTRHETVFTELCIACNVRVKTWRAYPENYTFKE